MWWIYDSHISQMSIHPLDVHTWWSSHYLACDSSVLWMGTVVDTHTIVGTVNESCLTTSALDIIQKNTSSSLAKEGTTSCNSTCRQFRTWDPLSTLYTTLHQHIAIQWLAMCVCVGGGGGGIKHCGGGWVCCQLPAQCRNNHSTWCCVYVTLCTTCLAPSLAFPTTNLVSVLPPPIQLVSWAKTQCTGVLDAICIPGGTTHPGCPRIVDMFHKRFIYGLTNQT